MGNLLLNIRGRLPWGGGGHLTGPHGPAGILNMCTTSRAVSPWRKDDAVYSKTTSNQRDEEDKALKAVSPGVSPKWTHIWTFPELGWLKRFRLNSDASLLFLSQEFPEKTRPVSFKHPLFQCPDMSPSPSVPSSGQSISSLPPLLLNQSATQCWRSNLKAALISHWNKDERLQGKDWLTQAA